MNCDRLVFLVTISVLSNLLTNALSVEATSRVNLVDEHIGSIDSTEISGNSNPIAQADPWSNSEQDNLKNPTTTTTAEETLAISKPLGLVGIATVSLISLILLKLLFVPPAKISPTTISSTVKTKAKTIKNNRDWEYPQGNRALDTSQSLASFEAPPQPTSISSPLVRSGDRSWYVIEEKPLVEIETISQLTVLNSNTFKIDLVVELIKYLQQPDEDLRREAILELARIGDSRAIEPLSEILSQVNSTDRRLVMVAITQIIRRSFQPLQELLFFTFDDANPEIKQNAIRDLAAIYAFVAPITKQLARMQVDRDMQVRQTAKLAIEQLNLCYFPCLFDDCPGNSKFDSNFNGEQYPAREYQT